MERCGLRRGVGPACCSAKAVGRHGDITRMEGVEFLLPSELVSPL